MAGRKYTRFAQDTTVDVEKTQRQIEELVTRYKASDFIRGFKNDDAIVAFRINACSVKFILPLPTLAQCLYTEGRGIKRSVTAQREAFEQVKRQRWRALKLSIQAKLESVEAGISTFEREFLPFIVLPGGKTVAEEILPRLPEAFASGQLLIAGNAQ